MAIDLVTLDFGALAAERDDALTHYFVESESFRRLKEGSKTVVLGPRGSGKSALFRKLADDYVTERQGIVIDLAPENYSYELFASTLASEESGSWMKQGAFAASWKFLIYVRAMKEVIGAGPKFKSGPAKYIYDYLRDNHANFEVNPIGVLISYLKRLEGLKIGSYEAGVKTRDLHKLYKLEEIEALLPALNEICEKRPVLILVDELDKGWDASENAVAFVAGLFQAATSVNQQTPNLRVVVSLRKELYDNIPALYADAQKVRDLVEVIQWDEVRLKEMISKRIAHSLGCHPESAWQSVFAETLDYRKAKSFNYIIDRTLYRPRELIQFCNDAREQSLAHSVQPPLNYDMISLAEYSYSEARLQDIASEYRFQFPGLLSVFETFRGQPANFTREALEVHCLEITCGDRPVDGEAKAWCEEEDPDRLIQILWNVGFLKAQAVGGLKARRRSGSQYLGAHQTASLNLPSLSRFHVHPMFRSHLGLKETTKE